MLKGWKQPPNFEVEKIFFWVFRELSGFGQIFFRSMSFFKDELSLLLSFYKFPENMFSILKFGGSFHPFNMDDCQ